jgi:hypothetical protein
MFSHPNVPSAAAFFSVSMFNLSGAVNVLLFLIIRPELLLFIPPEEFSETKSTSSAILAETLNYNHSPQPAGRELAGDGEGNPPHDANDVALLPIEPRPILDGV